MLAVNKHGGTSMRKHLSGFHSVIAGEATRAASSDNCDESLVVRVAAGNRLAMQVLFARHHTRVYRFVLRLLGSEGAAEDLTSEAFLSVWQQASRFQARSTFSTWLLAIARNKVMTELRRRRDVAGDGDIDEAADPTDDPEAAYAGKQRAKILRNCLRQLTREHREIIDLVYYHEKSVQEVAVIMDIPRNTVKTRMFYARRKLSKLLEAQGVARAVL
jgi:RNA polymerase sigma-70 factor, ECF subfamily